MESGQHVQCAYSTYCMSMSHLKECLVDDSYCYVRCGLTSENTKNWKYSQASGGHMVAQRKAQQRIAVKKKEKEKDDAHEEVQSRKEFFLKKVKVQARPAAYKLQHCKEHSTSYIGSSTGKRKAPAETKPLF